MIANNTIIQLTELDRILAQTTCIDEIVEIRAKLKALQVYAVNIGESREVCNELASARIRAERKAGAVLSELELVGNNQYSLLHGETPSLDTIGISRGQSHRWQMIAKLPDDIFENLTLNAIQSGDEITTRLFYKAALIHQRGTVKATGNGTDDTDNDIDAEYKAFCAGFRLGIISVHFDSVEAAYRHWKSGNNQD